MNGDQSGGTVDDADFDLDATLNVTLNGPPYDLDPHLEPSSGARSYWTPLYDTVTDTATGTPEPNLATEWERSDDGLTWTLQLRDDVTFHDGTPLDAAAVAMSIDRAMTHPDSTQASDLNAITSVEATDTYELTIVTDHYDPKLMSVLGGPAGAVLNPTAIDAGNDFSTNPDGSGAYVMTEYVPGQSVSYERADTPYWHPDGGRLAGFTLSLVDDFQTAINGVRSGQYDASWIIGLSRQVQDAVAADEDIEDVDFNPTSTIALYLNIHEAPFDNIEVRQAMAYAIDRDSLADAIFNGGEDCVPVSQHHPYEGNPLYVEGYDPYHYDLDQAKQLMADSGVTDPSISYFDVGSTATQDVGEALQPMLQAIGFDVDAGHGTTDTPLQYQRGEIDGMVVTNAVQSHPLLALSRYWMPGGAYHAADGEHQGLQDLIDQLSDPAVTDEEQHEIFAAMTEEMARLAIIIPVCAPTQRVLQNGPITGFQEGSIDRINMRFVGVLAE